MSQQGNNVNIATEDPFLIVDGPNFSGRSDMLKVASGLEESDTKVCDNSVPNVYIGPEIYNCFSGFSPTVDVELNLHACSAGSELVNRHSLVSRLKLDALSSRNPFSLSGGEQASLAIVSALLLYPGVFAIDCALEQLDQSRRELIMECLRHRPEGPRILVADNRMSEISTTNLRVISAEPTKPYSGPTVGDICAERLERFTMNPADISVKGLSFRYPSSHNGMAASPWAAKITAFLGHSRKAAFAHNSSETGSLLNNLCIDLPRSTILNFTGRNGVGKSTLGKLLCGLLRPSAGELWSNGQIVRPFMQPGRLFSYHFQNPDVQLFETTVENEIMTGMRHRRFDPIETALRCRSLLHVFGLINVKDEHPQDLSFSVRKRIALAASIATATSWLILDEPALGQDDYNSDQIVAIVHMLANLGLGVIVISHSEAFQSKISNEYIHLEPSGIERKSR